jgi:predicted ATPase
MTPAISTQFLRSIELRRDFVESFEKYPFSIPAVGRLKTLKLHPKATFFIGENGTGKSTLLEAIAVAAGMNPEGGGRNFKFATRATHSDLHGHLKLVRGAARPTDEFFLRAESLFNLATEIERLGLDPHEYGGALHERSHGESVLSLISSRFRGRGLYMLDEPEAALSPTRQLALLAMIHDLIRRDSQFVIATHSPILTAYPDSWIYRFAGGALRRVKHDEIEEFQVLRDFLASPESALRELLSAPPEERPERSPFRPTRRD